MAASPAPLDLSGPPRLTPGLVALMLAGALAIFAAAYIVGGLFGQAAESTAGAAGAREVAALRPTGAAGLTLRARNVAFDTETITVPAERPVTIRVENEDAGILHNIAVYGDGRAADLVARGRLFDGPRTRDYRFEGFPAGTYYFQCDLHPPMNGALIAR